MFEFAESVGIESPPGDVWKLLVDVQRWWQPSNPDHIRLDVESPNDPLEVGSGVSFKERVAGIEGAAKGRITRLIPGNEVRWEGDATYRYKGLRFRIEEGVSWRVEKDGEASKLSVRVWAKFPPNWFGRFLEWYSKSLLNVVDRDREHARRELEYLKATIESAS